MPTMLRDWWAGVSRLQRRLRYLWAEMDPDGVELLSAALSATFAILLLQGPTPFDHAAWYAGLAGLAALAKTGGVALEWRWLRLGGLGLGACFWTTLSYVLWRANGHAITWLCFATLALAQLWAARRVAAP